jgi:hypothetical protein
MFPSEFTATPYGLFILSSDNLISNGCSGVMVASIVGIWVGSDVDVGTAVSGAPHAINKTVLKNIKINTLLIYLPPQEVERIIDVQNGRYPLLWD